MDNQKLVWEVREARGESKLNTAVDNTSALASAGGTDRDLAATQFPRKCDAYNIIEFKYFQN